MRVLNTDTLAKVAFACSLVVMGFVWGVGSHARGWFPIDYVEQAWRQAGAFDPFSKRGDVARRVYERQGVRIAQPGKVEPGLTLVSTIWEDLGWKPGIRLVDVEGTTLHEWRVDPDGLFSSPSDELMATNPNQTNIHGSLLLPDGDVLFNLNYVGTVRMDACGEVVWRLRKDGHHALDRAADGTFWILGGTLEPPGEVELPERFPPQEHPVYLDRIYRVSGDGEILQTIDLLTVLFENGLERYIPEALYDGRTPTPYSEDLLHTNDVEALPPSMAEEYPLFDAGDLMVSVRNSDLVIVLDPATGKVKWHAAHKFNHQHDPDFIGDGWIGVFDNNADGTPRGTMLGGSRVVALRPDTGEEKILFPTPESEPFFTNVMGKWQGLSNGNLLLTESQTGRIVEVTPDGRTVWEWVSQPYDESRVPEVAEGTRYQLTPEEVAAWPCSPGDSTEAGRGE